MGKEKRMGNRVPTSITVDLNEPGTMKTRGKGEIIDLSIKGVSIETDSELEMGTPLLLKINVPVEVRGEIIRINKNEKGVKYGVKFTDVSVFDEVQLKKFISSRFKK